MSPIHCPNCGSKLKEDSPFCPQCGTSLKPTNHQSLQIKPNIETSIQDVWSGRQSMKSLWKWVILSLVIIGIPILLYKYYYEYYTISQDRVAVKQGILRQNNFLVKKDKITDVIINQGIMGRILNYGDVIINTAGTSQHEAILRGVSDPDQKRDMILKNI
jgi:uncharacterized membrane protein YdbT with pleckstrin-like domain